VSRDKLARYCQAWSDWTEVTAARNRLGPRKWDITEANEKKFYLWIKIMEQSEKVMMDFEREYGITPAAATRVKFPKTLASPTDKMNDFIKGKPSPIDVSSSAKSLL
jgi:phage terminase small subunit